MSSTEKNVDTIVFKVISDVLHLNKEQLTLEDSFYADYNCSSIDFLRILSELESKLHITLVKRSAKLPAPTTAELKNFKIRNLIQSVKESLPATN